MQIVDFSVEMMGEARALMAENYCEEREWLPVLPEKPPIPALDGLAKNGLGVAAVEGGRLLGFLGAYGPWQPVFCTPDTRGVFSPLHAHGVKKDNRVRIWQYLYQAAAEKWVRAGAASHAITLYAHDKAGQQALYYYGFGMRCMDLLGSLEPIPHTPQICCRELPPDQQGLLNPLRLQLNSHLAKSPCFMQPAPEMIEGWLAGRAKEPPRMFVAEEAGQIIAYIEAQKDGENYIASSAGIMNICGAFCLPEYRGRGVAQALLNQVRLTFRGEGYALLGVDCESFNPTALGFWRKYFRAYTHSLVRRIDENILKL